MDDYEYDDEFDIDDYGDDAYDPDGDEINGDEEADEEVDEEEIEDSDGETVHDENDSNEEEEDEYIEKDNKDFLDADRLQKRSDKSVPITRNIKYVTGNERVTSDIITKSELALILAIRAKQISSTGVYNVASTPKLVDAISIAIEEIEQKKCCLCITRDMGQNRVEVWDVNEMIIPMSLKF